MSQRTPQNVKTFSAKPRKMLTSSRTATKFDCSGIFEKYKCITCKNYKTDLLIELNLHYRNKHAKTRILRSLFKCKVCNFETFSLFLYKLHSRIPCKKIFKPKRPRQYKKKHIDKIPTDVSFQCETCSFNTATEDALSSHQLSSHGITSEIHWFRCQQCPYKSSMTNVQTHERIRHGHSQSVFCDYCSYSVSKEKYDLLRQHIRRRHASKPKGPVVFQCHQCPSKFKSRKTLKFHSRSNHADPNVYSRKCDYCDFQTKSSFSLRQHIIGIHACAKEIDWLKCHLCQKKFKFNFNLTYHIRRKHPSIAGCG